MLSGRIYSQQIRLVFVWQLLVLVVIASLSVGLAAAATQNASDTTTSLDGYNSMASLYNGNQRFRNVNGRRRAAFQQMVDESPSFMFLGCTDNRLTPASIFQAPVGAVLTQTNIGNQYHQDDTSTDAAITYAIQDLGVQHIIVLGHYGCKGAARAIVGSKEDDSISDWLEPIARLYKYARRRAVVKFRDARLPRRGLLHGATEHPDASDPGFRAFVEENVKHTVQSLKDHSILAKAYQVGPKTPQKEFAYNTFVHGFVYDEETGEVTNLQVSFGPPGQLIPDIPFEAAEKAKQFKRHKSTPNKGKVLKKPKYIL